MTIRDFDVCMDGQYQFVRLLIFLLRYGKEVSSKSLTARGALMKRFVIWMIVTVSVFLCGVAAISQEINSAEESANGIENEVLLDFVGRDDDNYFAACYSGEIRGSIMCASASMIHCNEIYYCVQGGLPCEWGSDNWSLTCYKD